MDTITKTLLISFFLTNVIFGFSQEKEVNDGYTAIPKDQVNSQNQKNDDNTNSKGLTTNNDPSGGPQIESYGKLSIEGENQNGNTSKRKEESNQYHLPGQNGAIGKFVSKEDAESTAAKKDQNSKPTYTKPATNNVGEKKESNNSEHIYGQLKLKPVGDPNITRPKPGIKANNEINSLESKRNKLINDSEKLKKSQQSMKNNLITNQKNEMKNLKEKQKIDNNKTKVNQKNKLQNKLINAKQKAQGKLSLNKKDKIKQENKKETKKLLHKQDLKQDKAKNDLKKKQLKEQSKTNKTIKKQNKEQKKIIEKTVKKQTPKVKKAVRKSKKKIK